MAGDLRAQEDAAMGRMATALEREAAALPADSEIRALMLRSANRYATAVNDSRPGHDGYRFQVVSP